MRDDNSKDPRQPLNDAPALNLDRREFIAGAAAAGLVVGTSGLLACDDGNAQATPEPPAQQKAAAPEPPAEAPKEEAPAAEAKQPDQQEEPAEKPAEPVQEKKFPMDTRGRVVQVTHSKATEKIKKVDKAVVAQMVDELLKKLTGEADAVKAMAHFVKKDDVVGIKVNALGSPFTVADPATAFAIAELVHKVGVPKKNIIIYDQYGSRMRKAGYNPQKEGQKDPADDFPVHFHGTLGYTDERVDLGGFNKNNNKPYKSQLPKVLERFTAVINVCCAKDHDLTGITGAIKNISYGNVERVPIYHCRPDCNPTCAHEGLCNVSRIYKHEKMGGLVRLVVADALRVLFNGGPQNQMTFTAGHNTLLASTDPVAIDRTLLEIVNAYRAEKSMKPIHEDQNGRRAPRFIEAAAKLGLGEGDLAKIKLEKHDMG